MSSLWNNLSNSFREVCNACDKGNIEQARSIVEGSFPEHMQEWFINSNISAESKEDMLLQMMSNEVKRTPKALELKDSLANKIDSKISRNLSEQFTKKIQQQEARIKQGITDEVITEASNPESNEIAKDSEQTEKDAVDRNSQEEENFNNEESNNSDANSAKDVAPTSSPVEEAELLQKAQNSNLALSDVTNRIGSIPVDDIPRMIDTLQERHSLAWKGDHLQTSPYLTEPTSQSIQEANNTNEQSKTKQSALSGFTFNKPTEQAPAQDKHHQLSAGRISNNVMEESTQNIQQTSKRLARPLTQKYKTKPRDLKIRTIGSKLYE